MAQSSKLQEKLAPYRPLLDQTEKQIIRLHIKKGKTGLYDSKIAGDPYFPKTDVYPVDGEEHPMKLLVQINFAQLPKLKDYPESGILQIFISVHNDLYGMNYDNKTEQKDFRIKFIEEPFLAQEELLKRLYTMTNNCMEIRPGKSALVFFYLITFFFFDLCTDQSFVSSKSFIRKFVRRSSLVPD